MKKTTAASFIALAVSSIVSSDAYADRGHWHGDIQHFQQYDSARWHGGYWSNDFHGGRSGWWWVVGPDWYYYPAPVYPYPDPFIPAQVIGQAPELPGQYWYCQNPAGYYPYVPACYVQWQPVASAAMASQAPVLQVLQPMPRQEGSQREVDDRQLNALAGEFYIINPSQPDAVDHIHNLKARVETFHQALFERHYNAMDILRDTENLDRRIGAKEAEFIHGAYAPHSGGI